MKFLFTLLSIIFCQILSAQDHVALKDINDHVGKNISLVVTISDAKFLSEKEMTFLNVGKFPNQKFTIVIKGDNRYKFKQAPEEMFKGKEIIVTGRVELYNGIPQIIVTEKEQIILSFKG